MLYVLKMDNPKNPRDQGTPTRVRLVGPFGDNRLACRWARDRRNNPHDNPCWQVVDLEEPTMSVEAPHEPVHDAIRQSCESASNIADRHRAARQRQSWGKIHAFQPGTDVPISTDPVLLQKLVDNLEWHDS